MEQTPVRALEVVPARQEAPEDAARGRTKGEGDGLRRASEVVAGVSAGVLVGGGAGMLAGVALEAINPYALGLIGAAVGACLPVLLARVPRRRGVPGG